MSDGFDFPIGKPNAVGYVNVQGFKSSRGHLGKIGIMRIERIWAIQYLPLQMESLALQNMLAQVGAMFFNYYS